MLELGIMKGGSCAFVNLLVLPQNHLAIDVPEQVSGLDAFAEHARRESRNFLTRYDVSKTETQEILDIFETLAVPRPEFDLVIDDASHDYELSVRAFEGLFPHVRKGGICAVKDWGCPLGRHLARCGSRMECKTSFVKSGVAGHLVLDQLAQSHFAHRNNMRRGIHCRGEAALGPDYSIEQSYHARGNTLTLL